MTAPGNPPGLGGKTLALLEAVKGLDTAGIDYEIRKLRAVSEWALKHLGVDFAVGDTVRIKDGYSVPRTLDNGNQHGWWPYRECLVGGAKAQVTGIDFNSAWHYWYADIVLEREWSVSAPHRIGGPDVRYWNGPVEDTPEGMTPPNKYDVENYPSGRRHTFSFGVEQLEKAHASDEKESP